MHVHLESEELSNLGKPLYTFDSDLVCNFQDRAKTVLTTEKKLVQITGTALFPGDIAPDMPSLSGGTITVFGQERRIEQGCKNRNPDGTVNVFKFGTKGLSSVDDDMVMPADMENFAPAIDGTTEEWYAMDAHGWAKSAMTGKKLTFSFKGKRTVGDKGNDYIASLAWKFGQDVMTKFEWVMKSGAKLVCDVVVNVTTPGGGDTTNIDALEFEVTCYGEPTYTPAVAV